MTIPLSDKFAGLQACTSKTPPLPLDAPQDTKEFTHEGVSLAYSPLTGICYRFVFPRHNRFGGWTIVNAGTLRGVYTVVAIAGNNQLLHRVVAQYFLNDGVALTRCEVVDHIKHANGTRNQDVLQNLRIVSPRENQQNLKPRTSNLSGVCWHKAVGKWFAQIALNGRGLSLGYFESELTAGKAYINACITHNVPHTPALEKFLNKGGVL